MVQKEKAALPTPVDLIIYLKLKICRYITITSHRNRKPQHPFTNSIAPPAASASTSSVSAPTASAPPPSSSPPPPSSPPVDILSRVKRDDTELVEKKKLAKCNSQLNAVLGWHED